MKSNKVFCDHCGKELDTQNDYDNIEIEMNHKWQKVDLCDECFEQLWSMIDEFCAHPTEKGGVDK